MPPPQYAKLGAKVPQSGITAVKFSDVAMVCNVLGTVWAPRLPFTVDRTPPSHISKTNERKGNQKSLPSLYLSFNHICSLSSESYSTFLNLNADPYLSEMSDDEHHETFEATGAGAALTYP